MADFPGAEGGIRTPTGSPPAVFEDGGDPVEPHPTDPGTTLTPN
jgi:hypothetical protein